MGKLQKAALSRLDEAGTLFGADPSAEYEKLRPSHVIALSKVVAKNLAEWIVAYATPIRKRDYELPVIEELDARTFETAYRSRKPFVFRSRPTLKCVELWSRDYVLTAYKKHAEENGTIPLTLGKALVNKYDAANPATVDQIARTVTITLEWLERVFAPEGSLSEGDDMPYYRGRILPDFYDDVIDLPPFMHVRRDGWSGIQLSRSGLWFGLAGNRTLPHRDPWHGFLVQVRGRKRVLLVAPQETRRLYIQKRKNDRSIPNVDFVQPDLARHPRFKEVKVLEAVLEPGDLVYIPPLWFHDVTCIDNCISMPLRAFTSRVEALLHPLRIDNLMHGKPMAW